MKYQAASYRRTELRSIIGTLANADNPIIRRLTSLDASSSLLVSRISSFPVIACLETQDDIDLTQIDRHVEKRMNLCDRRGFD